jgi:GNAT superfamily N-acetyltransferase
MIKEILFDEVPKEYLLQVNKSMYKWLWFGYIINNNIVAVAAIQKHSIHFYMRNVYCHELYRNKGHASSVVRYIQRKLNASIKLDCQFELISFYERLHFVPIKIRFANGKKYQRMIFDANIMN